MGLPAVAGLALSLGSSLLQNRAASKVSSARNRAASAEAARQNQFQRSSIADLENTQAGFTRDKQQADLDRIGATRADRLAENVSGDFTANDIPLTGSAPRVIREQAAKQLSEGLSKSKNFARRLGAFGAFGDAQFGNQVNLNRLAGDLDTTGRSSFNSSQILPAELTAANQAGGGLRGIADVLGAGGSVLSLAGATGGLSNPFGAATGTSSVPSFLRPNAPIPIRKPSL